MPGANSLKGTAFGFGGRMGQTGAETREALWSAICFNMSDAV